MSLNLCWSCDLTDLAQEGCVGGVVFRGAALLRREAVTRDGGLQGHGGGEGLVHAHRVAADGAAGVRVVAPGGVGPSAHLHTDIGDGHFKIKQPLMEAKNKMQIEIKI